MECVECAEDMLHLTPRFNIRKHTPVLIGVSVPLFTPVIYFWIVYTFWIPYKPSVDRDQCSCSCWDSVFKGSYEEYPARYKHVYFNCTWNSLLLYTLLVCTIITLYQITKNMVELVARQQARVTMVLLLATSLYPHYYSFWMYFNAWNDDFYEQVWHQAVFSVTEIISSYCVYHMCDTKEPISNRKLLTVFTMAIFHIVASGADQFVYNVVRVQGEWHQFYRDLGLMAVDALHLWVSFYYLWKCPHRPKVDGAQLKNDILCSFVTFCVLFILCRVL